MERQFETVSVSVNLFMLSLKEVCFTMALRSSHFVEIEKLEFRQLEGVY